MATNGFPLFISPPIALLFVSSEEAQDATSTIIGSTRCHIWRWRRCGANRRPIDTHSPEGRVVCEEINGASHGVGQTGFGGHLGFSDSDTHGEARRVRRQGDPNGERGGRLRATPGGGAERR